MQFRTNFVVPKNANLVPKNAAPTRNSASRPSAFVGLLARMVQSGRARLIHFVIDAAENDPALATRYFAGTTLLHFAAGAGCLEVVTLLLRLGVDPNIQVAATIRRSIASRTNARRREDRR